MSIVSCLLHDGVAAVERVVSHAPVPPDGSFQEDRLIYRYLDRLIYRYLDRVMMLLAILSDA